MVCRDPLVGLGDEAALLLRAEEDFVDALEQLVVADHLFVRAGGEDRRFVEEVFEVSPREAARHAGEDLEVHVGRERFVARVHFEDLFPAAHVGKVYMDLPVETAGTEQGGVEDVCAVGRRHDDDPLVGFKAVHLHEQLVERLLALVVPAAEARAALAADGVDLVDEHDAGLTLLRSVEQISDARRADADEHLDEVGAGNGEERHVRLPRHSLREQRFTRARRADEEDAFRDARAEVGEFAGAL